MGVKKVFSKIWHGIQLAEPYLAIAQNFAPPPFGVILTSLDALINRAEDAFPAAGSGMQKAEFFTVQGLKVAEILTGKNVDNPKTRAVLDRASTVMVQVKNFEAQLIGLKQEYADIVKELKDAIDSVKDPAQDDTPPAP